MIGICLILSQDRGSYSGNSDCLLFTQKPPRVHTTIPTVQHQYQNMCVYFQYLNLIFDYPFLKRGQLSQQGFHYSTVLMIAPALGLSRQERMSNRLGIDSGNSILIQL